MAKLRAAPTDGSKSGGRLFYADVHTRIALSARSFTDRRSGTLAREPDRSFSRRSGKGAARPSGRCRNRAASFTGCLEGTRPDRDNAGGSVSGPFGRIEAHRLRALRLQPVGRADRMGDCPPVISAETVLRNSHFPRSNRSGGVVPTYENLGLTFSLQYP